MAKEYAVMRLAKLKTNKDMGNAYNHNMRVFEVTNADPARLGENYEPVDLNGRTYQDAYEEEVSRMRQRHKDMQGRKIRKDAVRGFEVVLRYSHEADSRINQEEWVRTNVEWLNRMFNPPGRVITYTDGDGNEIKEKSDNVRSVVVHNDEGTPHIHAFIVPVDDRGRIRADYYTGGRGKMIKLQDDYAKTMEKFSLARGERYSVATAEQVSHYYRELEKAVEAELPEVRPGETAQEYKARADITYQNEKIHHRDDIVKKDQEIIQAKSEATLGKIDTARQERSIRRQLKKLGEAIRPGMGEEGMTEDDLRAVRRLVERDRDFRQALEKHPDREAVQQTGNDYARFCEWGRRERQKVRKKTQRPDQTIS